MIHHVKIEYFHASVHGNGAMVAEEFRKRMVAKGVTVTVHHIREVSPNELPPADLYLFSSPGRMGKPIGGVRRFLKKVRLPAGTEYAILTTELAPQPDKKTGRILIFPLRTCPALEPPQPPRPPQPWEPPRRGSTAREDKKTGRILIFPPATEPANGRPRPDS